jgi:hypothetical protein
MRRRVYELSNEDRLISADYVRTAQKHSRTEICNWYLRPLNDRDFIAALSAHIYMKMISNLTYHIQL